MRQSSGLQSFAGESSGYLGSEGTYGYACEPEGKPVPFHLAEPLSLFGFKEKGSTHYFPYVKREPLHRGETALYILATCTEATCTRQW